MKIHKLKIRRVIENFSHAKKEGVLSNFFSLSLLQALNLLTPLLLVPFVVKTLGIKNYGWIAICQSFIGYITILVDYGFNLTAVRDISSANQNKEVISKIYSSVTVIKITFSLLILLILYVISKSFFSNNDVALYLQYSLIGSFFLICFPSWLFQGIHKLNLGAAILLLGKIIHIILCFLVLENRPTIKAYFMLQAVAFFISMATALIVINFLFKIKFTGIQIKNISIQLKNGWNIFVANVATNIYTGSSPIILGALHGPIASAMFGIADQIHVLLRQPLNILTRIIYPKICVLMAEKKDEFSRYLKPIVLNFLIFYLLIIATCLIWSTQISIFFSKDHYLEISGIIKIICWVPIVVLLLNLSPYLYFLATKLDKVNRKVSIIGAIIGICLNFILSYFFSYTGAAIAILTTELIIGSIFFQLLMKENKNASIF